MQSPPLFYRLKKNYFVICGMCLTTTLICQQPCGEEYSRRKAVSIS